MTLLSYFGIGRWTLISSGSNASSLSFPALNHKITALFTVMNKRDSYFICFEYEKIGRLLRGIQCSERTFHVDVAVNFFVMIMSHSILHPVLIQSDLTHYYFFTLSYATAHHLKRQRLNGG